MSGGRRPAAPAGSMCPRDDHRDSREPLARHPDRGRSRSSSSPVNCCAGTGPTIRAPTSMQARFGDDGLIQLTGAIGDHSMLAMTVNACELEVAPAPKF